MVVEIAQGYSALKAAFDMAKGLKDIHDQVKLNSSVIEFQSKILEAQEAVGNARERLGDLQAEIDRMNDWTATASRYRLKDFGGQSFAYELIPDKANGEPLHLTCPECFRTKNLSILQYDDTYHGRKRYECLACGKKVMLGASDFSSWRRTAESEYDPYS